VTSRPRTPASHRHRATVLTVALTVEALGLTGALAGAGPGHGALAVIALAVITGNRTFAAHSQGRQHAHAWALAHTDDLTTMNNRRAFLTDVNTTLRTDQSLGVLLIDLDAFKTVNDTHGHPVGDRVLQEVAERIQAILDPGCRAYRLGGDEFAVTAPDSDPDSLARRAQELRAALSEPLVVHEARLQITASIGTAIRAPEDIMPTGLLARADAQMYRAKASTP
jgi:diguanylate cyclase (GGDEF)-like protein